MSSNDELDPEEEDYLYEDGDSTKENGMTPKDWDDLFQQTDLEIDHLAYFEDTIKDQELEQRLTKSEIQMAYALWRAADDLNFIINVPRNGDPKFDNLTEGSTNRAEHEFMNLRQQLFESSGWKGLPATIQTEVQKRLFSVAVDDDRLVD